MKGRSRLLFLSGVLAALAWIGAGGELSADPGNVQLDWPQWRGPHRDGISGATGLLKTWPEEGPKVLWRFPAGEGYSGISIDRGRLYTLFGKDDDEFAVCLDASAGDELWRFRTDSKFIESRGNGPRSTPTVDGDWVYVLSTNGKLYAVRAESGEKIWSRDLRKLFGSPIPDWGFSGSPLIENDLLLLAVGGEGEGRSIAAFDKESGDVAWTTYTDGLSYSSPIAVTFNGVRQIVFLTANNLLAVSPADGSVYWTFPWTDTINITTPIFIPDDKIFISAAYDKGAALLKMKASSGGVEVEEIWMSRVMKNWFNSSVLQGEYLYGFDNATLKCIEAVSGEEEWKMRGFGRWSLVLVDGHLILLGENGELALVEATPEAYREKARVQMLQGKCWTPPTLAGGRLYIRNEEELVCLDVSGPGI